EPSIIRARQGMVELVADLSRERIVEVRPDGRGLQVRVHAGEGRGHRPGLQNRDSTAAHCTPGGGHPAIASGRPGDPLWPSRAGLGPAYLLAGKERETRRIAPAATAASMGRP